jgi:hypothetical protein
VNALQKGIVVGALQCAVVLSLAGKLFYDRETCPRVWVPVERRDPEMPIRGRYLALRLEPEADSPWRGTLAGKNVVFFVPEQLTEVEKSGARRLWAEVTIPRSGPPRPIQLAVR